METQHNTNVNIKNQSSIMCSSEFSFSSTAEEVTHGIDATGLTAIVTGHIIKIILE